jgi:hypothetical protein
MEAAWDEVVFRTQTCLLDPNGHGVPRGLGDLELHPSRGPLVHDDGPRGDAVAVADVADLQPDEIASTQLALDIKIEQREISCSAKQLKLDADRPDFFELERRLLANQLALVPRFRERTATSSREFYSALPAMAWLTAVDRHFGCMGLPHSLRSRPEKPTLKSTGQHLDRSSRLRDYVASAPG